MLVNLNTTENPRQQVYLKKEKLETIRKLNILTLAIVERQKNQWNQQKFQKCFHSCESFPLRYKILLSVNILCFSFSFFVQKHRTLIPSLGLIHKVSFFANLKNTIEKALKFDLHRNKIYLLR